MWRNGPAGFLFGALASLAIMPAAAYGQSQIAGRVTDTTGGLLPGVTVEASSPALIEGSRVATTDGEGQYTITNLRPGLYKVTFTLAGFSTLVRDELNLPADFTMTISVQLRVGSLAEMVAWTSA